MTENAENSERDRLEELKSIIRELHAGADPSDLRVRFADLIRGVEGSEISKMEQQLIEEGMPASEIKRLCDVHVQVFREALDSKAPPDAVPGHPVHTLRAENTKLSEAAERMKDILGGLEGPGEGAIPERQREELESLYGKLTSVEQHYLRKENQLFPLLERRGVTGPTQVMWAIHDDVRELLKGFGSALRSGDVRALREQGTKLAQAMLDMIYKEENVLFPTAMDVLSEADWVEVRSGEEEIGYALVKPGDEWKPREEWKPGTDVARASEVPSDRLPLDTGALTLEQLNLMLKHLPLDVTFVDENDEVRYYSATRERIFPRSPAVIGRRVQNCHPPDSVDVVTRILETFKSGEKNVAAFWIRMGEKLVHIRYFAVRDASGDYRGTIEVTQDVAPIQGLSGESRLLDWDA